MPARFEILRSLEENTASTLHLVRAAGQKAEVCLRRFKTTKPEEIEGLKELFSQLATVSSPHLETVLDFDVDQEGFYTLTQPQPESETLSTVLERGPLTIEEFEAVTQQLLEVLNALHEQAIVHGSLRTDGVRITGKSATDWLVTLHGFGEGFSARDDSKEELIRAYRCTAPEQWQDGTTRRRTDVYSLGCVLYEALAARPPFDGRTLKEVRQKHLSHDLPPLQKLAVQAPGWICAWVMHLLAADPEQRPRKAGAVRELFERREAPILPELPPQSESLPAVSSTPPVSLTAQPISEPVVLPIAQPTLRHATSSTIPIAMGPHVAANMPRHPSSAVIQRRTYAAPRKPSSSLTQNKKPMLIAIAAILLMLVIFILPRCGQSQPAPTKGKPTTSKGKPATKQKQKQK